MIDYILDAIAFRLFLWVIAIALFFFSLGALFGYLIR
jgi:hypothetical protein